MSEQTTQPTQVTPESQQQVKTEAQVSAKIFGKYDTMEAAEKSFKEIAAAKTRAETELANLKKGQTTQSVQAVTAGQKATTETGLPTAESQVAQGSVFEELFTALHKSQYKVTPEIKAKFGLSDERVPQIEEFVQVTAQKGLSKLNDLIVKEGLGVTVDEVLADAGKYYKPEQMRIIEQALNAGLTGTFMDVARTVAENKKPAGMVGSAGGEAIGGGFTSAKEMQAALASSRMG